MKVKSILFVAAILLAMVFSFAGCKKAADTAVVTVIVSPGVTGTPAAGVHYVNVGDELAYSFTLEAGYTTLTVLLDGSQVAAAGTLTVSSDHTLQANADANGQFTLIVTQATGVTGTPAAGTFTYAQGTKVNYSYGLAAGYSNLVVKLDGTAVASSGTITMDAAHVLTTSAVTKKNIQGSWALAETYNDDSSFNVIAVFTGSFESGAVTDSDGGSGTYTVAGDSVAFTIVFPGVTYSYTGTFSTNDTMSGSCKRYQTSTNTISGTWTATRAASTNYPRRGSSLPGPRGSKGRGSGQ